MNPLLRVVLASFLLVAGLAGQGEGQLTVKARFEPAKASPGDTVTLIIDATIAPNYHVYGSNYKEEGVPTLTTPTSPVLATKGGFEVPGGDLHVDPDFPDLQSWWISEKVTLRQKFTVKADAKFGKVEWKGGLNYLACTPQMCDPPFTEPLAVTLEVAAKGAAKASDAARPAAQDKQKTVHQGNHQTMKLVLVPNPARPGEVVDVEVRVEMDPTWYNYGSDTGEDGVPVSIDVKKGALPRVGQPDIPPGKRVEEDGQVVFKLENTWTMRQKVRVPDATAPGEVPVAVEISYMACDPRICEDQIFDTLRSTLKVESGAARKEYAYSKAQESKPPVEKGKADQPEIGEDEDAAGMPLLQYLLLAIGAGLFALIMPCTYPMIPITISFFTKQAEMKGGSALPLALLYGAGIVASFVLVGVAVGPAMQDFATNGWVNIVLGSMFVFFALSLFGLVDLRPPQFLMNSASKASTTGGPIGVFLMGVTLCVSSFACTAPFLGFMLAAGVNTGGTGRLILGMATFGLTMALPFVILSLVPGKLPKSGVWMNTAKVLFGFIELAAALKFFSITDVSWELGLLPRELFLTIWAALFAVCGVYMLGFIKMKGETGEIGGGRLVTGIATVCLSFYCMHGASGYVLDNEIMHAFEPPYRSRALGGGNGSASQAAFGHEIIKDDFDGAVASARRQGKLLLVNFTGYN